MRSAAACTLLLLLAGCGQPSASPDDRPGIVEVAPGVLIAADRGAVRALVRDDAGLPVAQARVQLTGTDFFGDTGPAGVILFHNVTPGAHTVRVERSGYAVFEQAVHVNASQMLELPVHLLPTAFGSYRPHAHDMWRGQTQHVLFDGAFDYQNSHYDSDVSAGPARPVFRTAVQPNRNESTSFALVPLAEEVDGEPNLVYPGTARIEVTVSWEATDSTLSAVGVAYTDPGGVRRVLPTQPAGSTWTIVVERTDVGHQRFTFWDFYLYPGNEVGQPSQWEPGLVAGPFQVKIVAHRGDGVPLEPEHPDFWGDATRLLLLSADDVALAEPSNPTGDRHRDRGHIRLPDGTLVPPGTVRLEIQHTWTYRTAPDATQADMDYVLTWRTADQHRYLTPLSDYRRTPGQSCGDRCMAYDIDVDPAWLDGYYQTRSLWTFLPSVEGYEDEAEYRPDPRAKDHHLEIVAWRTAS